MVKTKRTLEHILRLNRTDMYHIQIMMLHFLPAPQIGRNISRLYPMKKQVGEHLFELGEIILQIGELSPEPNNSLKKLGETFPHLGERFPYVGEGKNKVENGGCRHENRI